MNKITYILVLLALILAGCSSNNSTSSDGDSSSAIAVIPDMSSSATSPIVNKSPISLYKMGGLAKKSIDVINNMPSMSYNIDLDTIHGTTGFSFIIKNNGTSDITELKFAFDLDYFKVTPTNISTLGAPSTATGIEQLIKVTVEHGTLASGRGFTNVLTGTQYGKLTITGKNADGDFSVTYNMRVYAKRMIININMPDTVMEGTIAYGMGRVNSLPIYEAHRYRYIQVDTSSEDCYLNMAITTLDTSNNIQMNNMKDYYSIYHHNYMILLDSSATGITHHAKFYEQLRAASQLNSYSKMDNNCVILVNDNWPANTQEVGEIIPTQYIID